MRTLVGLSVSPWTEKARWALDHHGLDYRYDEFTPMIGEPFLRARTRRYQGKLTVPVLLDGDEAIVDSLEIALYADRIGSGRRLFPEGGLDAIRRWNEVSERGLGAGRALVLRKTAESAEARAEALPKMVPRVVRTIAAPVTRLALEFLARKYATQAIEAQAEEQLASALDELRTELAGRRTLLDGFSYADITAVVLLQLVRPVDGRYIRLGPATRACWTNERLAASFGDLIAWRDAIYAEHRPLRRRRAA